jgi:hypothetical protein
MLALKNGSAATTLVILGQDAPARRDIQDVALATSHTL